ncbi:MAG: DUF3303 family protein [Planctomycetota bacterium]
MLFAVHYETSVENRDASLERFLSLGNAAPSGVKVIGHWASVTLLEGWGIIEADDVQDLGAMFRAWTDLNINHITPVLDEDGVRKLMAK